MWRGQSPTWWSDALANHPFLVGAVHAVVSSETTAGRPGFIPNRQQTGERARMTVDPIDTPRLMGGSQPDLVLAMDLGGTKCHGVLAAADGTVVGEDLRVTGIDAYQTILSCYEHLQGVAKGRDQRVQAVAIAVPAIVEPASGRVHGGPNVGWNGFDLGARLAADVELPLVVENDAHLAAVGEARRGAARGVSDFIVVSVGTGIGAAAVVGGSLVTGRHNAAGEIGSMVLDRSWLAQPPPGGHGWFESVASGPAIAASGPGAQPADGSSLRPTTESVFNAMRAGDPASVEIVARFLDHLAMALIAVTGVLDPELVVLDGGVGRKLTWVVDDLAERVARHVPVTPRIAVSLLTPTASLVGATIAAVEASRSRAATTHFGTFARSLLLAEKEVVV